MNTSRVVCWGRWGQRGCPDAARAGAAPHGAMLLGTLRACRQLVPTAPRPDGLRGQAQAPPLLAASTVPTPKIKVAGRDRQTTNDSTSWS